MKDLDSFKQLAKDIIGMCNSGGFRLTKFILNSNQLLLPITEYQKRLGIGDIYRMWKHLDLLEFERMHFLFWCVL